MATKCLQTLEYDLRFEAEPPVVTAGTALSATPLVQLKGTITETRECVDAGVATFQASQPSFLNINQRGRMLRPIQWNCPDPDTLGDDGNYLLASIWGAVKTPLSAGCRTPGNPNTSLVGVTIKATCYFDRGLCSDLSGSTEGNFISNLLGVGDDDGFACDYEGPALSLPQPLFGSNSNYQDITWTPGSDIPFGHLPANVCDVPDDYEFDCNLFQFIADKIAEKKLSNAIGTIVINALGTAVTGGAFGLLDLLSAIRAIRSGGTIIGDAAQVLQDAVVEGYNEYLRCLADSLEV